MNNNSLSKEVLRVVLEELSNVSNIQQFLNVKYKISQLALVENFVTDNDGAILVDDSIKAMLDNFKEAKTFLVKFQDILRPIKSGFDILYKHSGENELIYVDDKDVARLFLLHDMAYKVGKDGEFVALLQPAIKAIKWAFAIKSVKHVESSMLGNKSPSPLGVKEQALRFLSIQGFDIAGEQYESIYSDGIEESVTTIELVKVVNY